MAKKITAVEFYDSVKHKDDWNVDVIYPTHIADLIMIAKAEGALRAIEEVTDLLSIDTLVDRIASIRKLSGQYQQVLEDAAKLIK